MPAGYIKALKDNAKQVDALEGAQAAEFLRLLTNTQDVIRGRLLALGDASQSINVFSLRQILGETEAGIKILEQKVNGEYEAGAKAAVTIAIDHIGDELERLSRTFDGKPLSVDLNAVKALADPAQGLLASHYQSSVQRYGIDLLNGVRQRLFVSLRTGDPFDQVVREVAGTQGPFGTVGRANAERLVRTETSQAYGAAKQEGGKQAASQIPGLVKVWLHIGSFLCPVCMPLHGTSRSIDGTWLIRMGSRTKEIAHPPGHPRCVCTMSMMKPSWKDKMKALGYLEQPEGEKPTL